MVAVVIVAASNNVGRGWGRWIAFSIFTCFQFGYWFYWFRRLWNRWSFWITTLSFLILHLGVWLVILPRLSNPAWWLRVAVVPELVIFIWTADKLDPHLPRRNPFRRAA